VVQNTKFGPIPLKVLFLLLVSLLPLLLLGMGGVNHHGGKRISTQAKKKVPAPLWQHRTWNMVLIQLDTRER
jgi:hypothetical protein